MTIGVIEPEGQLVIQQRPEIPGVRKIPGVKLIRPFFLHPFAEGLDLFPLGYLGLHLFDTRRGTRRSPAFTKKPHDFRIIPGLPTQVHSDLELFLGTGFIAPGGGAEALAQQANDQGQRTTIFLQGLAGNQGLGAAHPGNAMVLPVQYLELESTGMGGCPVVGDDVIVDGFAFLGHVARRSKKQVVLGVFRRLHGATSS
jgi:hypothetical protein